MRKITLLSLLIALSVYLPAQENSSEMILVEGGTFKMGNDESSYFDEYPDHYVTVNGFYISKYEVTIEEYTGFCRTAGLDLPAGDPKMPITNVSWEEAIMYCNWLSRFNRLDKCYRIIRDEKNTSFQVKFDRTANGYRLPTEAEWEYAARGGIHKRNLAFSGSNQADDVAWYANTSKMLHIVGEKKPNDLGIYDMTGNAQEWCFDVYLEKYYENSPKENPANETGGVERVNRGGSFNSYEESLRISKRFYNLPDHRDETLGFRVVRNQ